MEKYKVSIIVALFNAEKTIEKTIDSLLSQKLDNLQIIIVNDGSSDGSIDVVKNKEHNNPRSDIDFYIIDRENKGIARTRQEGIDNARGKYIIHLDSDDYADDLWLLSLYEKAENTRSEIVICDYYNCNHLSKRIVTNSNHSHGYLYIESILKGTLGGFSWNKLIRTDFIRKNNLKFLDIEYGEDLLFFIMAFKLYPNISHVSEPLVFYKLDSNNSITRKITYEKILMVNKLIDKVESLLENDIKSGKISRKSITIFKLKQKSWFIQCSYKHVPDYVWDLYGETSRYLSEVKMPRYIKLSIFISKFKRLRFISRLIVKIRHSL